MVTPEAGGVVVSSDGNARLAVPPGALSDSQPITITMTAALPPSGITADSPVYTFQPAGLVFSRPATVTFTFEHATHPTVYWSSPGGGFDAIGGRVAELTIAAEITHFSSAFVGEIVFDAGAGDEPPTEPTPDASSADAVDAPTPR